MQATELAGYLHRQLGRVTARYLGRGNQVMPESGCYGV
jgi:hypothetical protein